MKLFSVIMMLSILQVSATGYAQKLTLKQKAATLEDVFKQVKAQTGFKILCDADLIKASRAREVDFKDAGIEQILHTYFPEGDFTVTLKNKTIIIKQKAASKSITEQTVLPQPIQLTGIVTDSATGQPLAGVTIQVKGGSTGTVTDAQGGFTLKVPDDAVLVVSYLGYTTKEISVDGKTELNIVLSATATGLDQLVVVGYGTQKKSDLTGAVSTIDATNLAKSGHTSIDQMLAGQAAGLQVRRNDAQPGGGVSLLIRGAPSTGAGNAPLIVIDGFPVTGGTDPGNGTRYSIGSRTPLSSINPNDIASIEILKDVSATAIYGARAANGVILITTKSGHSGKVKVNYSFRESIQKMSNPWNMMNATEYMKATNNYRREKWMADNKIGVYGNTDPSTVTPWTPAYSKEEIANAGKGTDWVDEVTRTGLIQEHNISMSGGAKGTSYFASFNSFNQKGVIKKNNFKRTSARLNLDQQINKWLKAGIRATGSIIHFDNPSLSSGGSENSGIIRTALRFTPTLPVRLPNGEYSIVENSAFFPNPVSLLEITNQTKKNRLFSQAYLEIYPIEGLTIRSQMGFDKKEGEAKIYLPKTTLYGQKSNGEAHINENKSFDKLFNTTITYSRNFTSKIKSKILLGYEYEETTGTGLGLLNTDFPTDAFLFNSMQSGESPRPGVSSYKYQDKLASYFGRINVNISDKYLFTLTMRADGSTRFGEGNKWGYFPSGAFAWRVINENFMENSNVFSDLKLRLSLGQTGNSNISGAFALYGFGHNYVFGNNVSQGVQLTSYSNENLKWETTTAFNLGLDFGFFKNRISGNINFYHQRVSGLLGSLPLKDYLPLYSVSANLGETVSDGLELTLNTVNVQNSNFNWSSTVNISGYRDRWKERNPGVVLASYQSETDPIRVHWGYITEGLVQPGEKVPAMPGAKPGVLKIKDINGYDANNNLTGKPDGIINDADIVKIANADPDFIFGFTNTFKYKNFDLNIHIYGMVGIRKTNEYLGFAWGLSNIDRGYNYPDILNKFWSSEHQEAKYPNASVTSSFPGAGQFLLQRADFARIQNITLGYTFPLMGKIGNVINKARVYLDASNPLVITGFSGIDPEYGGFYPPQQTYTIGLNIQF